jgi:hypothetical protein
MTRTLLPLALALALPACATTQVQTTQAQIARAYADYALIRAGLETMIATVPAVTSKADVIRAWEARIDAAFAAARAAGDVAAAYAALHEAQQAPVTTVAR